MDMQVTFLGTTSMFPTKERNHQAVLISHGSENILLDCGEGTQRQLRLAGISPPKITKLLITHWHGDHTLGIPGLIENLSKSEYKKTLEVYGPKHTVKNLQRFIEAHNLRNRINYEVHEIKKACNLFSNDDIEVSAALLEHGTPCIGYLFKEHDKRKMNIEYLKKVGITPGPILAPLQEGKDTLFQGKKIKAKDATFIRPGKKLAFITDTRMCNSCYKLAKDADLLICESTFGSELKDQAKNYYHLTASQAASLAKKYKCKRLILTHFSQRYKDVSVLLEEAKKIFPNVEAAKDFMKISL